MKVVKLLRAHVGVAAVSAAVILGGAGAATAVVATSSDTPVVEEPGAPVQTAAPAGTTEAPAPAVADAPAPVTTAAPVAPGEPVQAATVDDVTPSPQVPAPQPIPGELPADQDMSGVGTIGPDGNYTMAPPIQNPGEPPVGDGFLSNSGAVADKLPGEPGYVPPAG